MDAEVTSDTAAQFYDVRSPTGETILARRRLVTTLGVGAYDLIDRGGSPGAFGAGGDRPMGPELSFRARMRYDADYGASPAETDNTNYNRLIPGFSRGPVDLMYGYLEGRRFFSGWLGFKLGRQYIVDSLGWWSFDGGQVNVTTPFFLKAEAYGGLEVRGGMPLSTPRFERDGIWRGGRSGYDPNLYPSFQPSDVAPAFGAAIESTGVTWLHGRLTYRRVYNTGGSNVSEFASGYTTPVLYDGTRISQERIGYSIDGTWATVGNARGGFVYDLYRADVTNIYGSLDGFVTPKLTLSLDYDYYVPSYDADSIWNFFAGEPMNDIGARANFDATDRLSLSGGGHARMYTVQTSPYNPWGSQTPSYPSSTSPNIGASSVGNYYPTNGHPFDGGGNLAGRYRWGEGVLGLHGIGNFGSEGDRVGADAYGERTFETRYVLSGRAGVWQWHDKIRPDRDATSFGYVLGLGYRFAPRSRATFEWEHDINRLAGQRFRLMLWLALAVTK
jgi:hypothetical protein